jgi:hypothetical protein
VVNECGTRAVADLPQRRLFRGLRSALSPAAGIGRFRPQRGIEPISRFAVLLETATPAATRECGTAMCDKCVEIDGKIEHYQRLSSNITDQRTLDGIKELIERMKAQKAALHPEQIE